MLPLVLPLHFLLPHVQPNGGNYLIGVIQTTMLKKTKLVVKGNSQYNYFVMNRVF